MPSSRTPSPTSRAQGSPRSRSLPANANHDSAAQSGRTSRPVVTPLVLPPAVGGAAGDVRRPSVSFLAQTREDLPAKGGKVRETRRMSSPPPPPLFQTRVAFDTFDKPADFIKENSFTLMRKHKDYEYTKRSRTFLCGLDDNDYSSYALEWLLDELVDDGDEIVCLRVVEKDDSIATRASVERGSYRAKAEELMEEIEKKNTENKAISLVLEFSLGKVQDVIGDMIKLYEPAILIVGTRGRSQMGIQGLLPGSVSKYCLQHSPVPVIVVRPNSKRAKSKRKRMQDPTRHAYRDILAVDGGHVLDSSNRNSLMLDDPQPATDAEAAAVAAAIGYKPEPEPTDNPLTKVESARTDVTDATDLMSPISIGSGRESSPEDMRSPARLLKSPDLRGLESPAMSEDESEEEDPEADASPKEGAGEDGRNGSTAGSGLWRSSFIENIRPAPVGSSGIPADEVRKKEMAPE